MRRMARRHCQIAKRLMKLINTITIPSRLSPSATNMTPRTATSATGTATSMASFSSEVRVRGVYAAAGTQLQSPENAARLYAEPAYAS